jgi:hypothetical protein
MLLLPEYFPKKLDRPLPNKDGGILRTIRDACDYMTNMDKKRELRSQPPVQPEPQRLGLASRWRSRPVALGRLAQNEERECTAREARRRGRMGQKEMAMALTAPSSFFIVQEPGTNCCTIIGQPPAEGAGTIVGDGAYADRATAEADMRAIAACAESGR